MIEALISDKITIIDSYEDAWVNAGLKLNDLILEVKNIINNSCIGWIPRYHYGISEGERIELIRSLKRECSREVWKSNCKALSVDNPLDVIFKMVEMIK
jgi:hypothetical protein